MTNVEKLEHEVEALSAPELSKFRQWFLAFDAQVWDEQIERDVEAGAFDSLADAAIAEHRAGRSRLL
ncbi:MAG: hypothetical protein JWM95_2334 [Gemmatimonadetes bacterium]|nr:hypothetical protein [Gemmatimonadota bacterium]